MLEEHGHRRGATNESSRLDGLLTEAVTGAGAHIGAAYLLDEGGQVLQMAAVTGLPAPIARAWSRVRTGDPIPIAVAVREQRLIWITGREQLAREYPEAALTLPYHFAAALSPVCADGRVCGGIMMLWPAGRIRELSGHRREIIERACDEIGRLINGSLRAGRPVTAGPLPRILPPRPPDQADPRLVALDCLNRLPEGHCALNTDGHVTLLSAPAADLFGRSPADLIGERLWDALPWLRDPTFQDAYRAAIVGHEITDVTTRAPGGRALSFRMFPGPSGVTLRITAAMDVHASGGRPPRVIAVHEMLRLAAALARAVTAQEVIDLVADHVMPVYDVQALAILTSVGGRKRVAASRGFSRRAVVEFDGRPDIGPTPSGRDRPGFFSTWEELHEAYPDALRSDGMCAWAFLPLITSGRPIGSCVLAYDRPHSFGTDERATLTALAGLIAQAFERARLYDVKHQLAQCLQARLLPHTLPRMTGLEVAARYVPATPGMDIGGDFYDLIRLGDDMAAAVIGDVQGHDVTAAALMGQVRTAVRAHATAGADPGEVLAHTNRLLTELSPDRFTSCLYVCLDLGGHTVHLASAGHPPPVLGRPDGPGEVVGTTPGPLLGVDPEATYATTPLPMPPGSVLLLYTDGLIEEPGIDLGDSMAALAARFRPEPGLPLHGLADALTDPAAIEQRPDDIAVLLLRNSWQPG
ncbi:SpoIIE family protein phosphatase [Nonomuraea sp. NPDC004580]|uniref:SpoIIE family protein phosphatase n=1 Tax=Nonomuraea sp. NPDC004580 TaxID=3154552 RepID=UPI0033BB48A4